MIGSAVYAELKPEFSVTTFGRGAGNDKMLDLSDPDSITADLFKGCDTLVHCAGVVDEDFKESSKPGFLKGTYAAKKLAEAAFDAGVRTFIYVSSAHIYGPLTGRIDENSPPNPVSDYGISHYATEQVFRRTAAKDKAGRFMILRPCATYGMPKSLDGFNRWTLVPFLFPKKATQDGKIHLLAGSDQVLRNFISAKAIGQHIAAFLGKNSESLTINALGPYQASILDFARLSADVYKDVTGQDCPVTMADGTSSFPTALDYASIHKNQPEGEDIRDFTAQLITLLADQRKQAA